MMKYILKNIPLLALVFLGTVSMAHASSHAYDCGDFQFQEGVQTCTGGVWTFDGAVLSGELIDSDSAVSPPGAGGNAHYSLTNGTRYYVYVSGATNPTSGTVFTGSYYFQGGGNFGTNQHFDPSAGLSYDFVADRPSMGAGGGLYFGNSPGDTYAGDIGPICISDVDADDAMSACGAGPEPGPGEDRGVFDYLFGSATTTASSTLTIVSDPNRDFANGLFLFTAWFFGIYWVFSKKR